MTPKCYTEEHLTFTFNVFNVYFCAYVQRSMRRVRLLWQQNNVMRDDTSCDSQIQNAFC